MLQAQIGNPGTPIAVVALGYNTFPDSSPAISQPGYVAETVQAKYLLEGILDAYRMFLGNDGSYIGIHELLDADGHYGLFHNDGTPKLSATMLRIFNALMVDTFFQANTFHPGTLNYTITGTLVAKYSTYVNTGLQEVLTQSSDGRFFLWLYNEQPLNDSSTNATLSVGNTAITLNFNELAMTAVKLYDPFAGFDANGNVTPFASYTNVTSVGISLPPWPILAVITHP